MARANVKRLTLASSMVVYGEGFGLCSRHGAITPAPRNEAALAAGRFEPPCPHCGKPLATTLVSEDTQLDLPDASIDAIFCHQLIHHVANQKGALRELHRVLAPGGILLLAESCEAFIETWQVRWFFRHPHGVQKPAEGYLDLVRAAGFVFGDADVRIWTPWWSLPDLGFTRKLGLVRRPPVATELLVVARKAPG